MANPVENNISVL